MNTGQLIQAIQQLSLQDRILIAESILRSIKEEAKAKFTSGTARTSDMAKAAKLLLKDYETDEELTAFTHIDSDTFHETR